MNSTKPMRQRLPDYSVETQQQQQQTPEIKELNIPIPISDTSEINAKEQIKAGNKEVKTKDGKDGIDNDHGFMRNSYHFDEQIKDTWIPLSERKKIFNFLYPNGALKAKLVNSSYKFATADAGAFRDINDIQPFATESGAANINDLPFILKRKVSQVATSNATHRVLVQAGIPTTLNELFLQMKTGEIDESVIERLKSEDHLFINAYNDFKQKNKQPETTAQGEWVDVDELDSQLEEQEYKIPIGNEFYEQDEIIDALENELITYGNESLLEKIVSIINTIAKLKQSSEQTPAVPEDGEEKNKSETPATDDGKRWFWIARDIKTGNIIKKFRTRAEAAQFANVTVAAISACLNPSTNNKSAGGFKWSKVRQ